MLDQEAHLLLKHTDDSSNIGAEVYNTKKGQGKSVQTAKRLKPAAAEERKQADPENSCCSWQDKHKPPSQSQQGEGVYTLHLFYCSYTRLKNTCVLTQGFKAVTLNNLWLVKRPGKNTQYFKKPFAITERRKLTIERILYCLL